MGGFVMAAQLILSLTILVFIHELGHFLAAKYFNMRVDRFYIFFDAFGTKLWSKKIGETEYGIGWLPLGGYVKIAGMIDESMDTKALSKEPEDWEFRAKPAWQRFIVMIGGIVFNLILGVIIFAGYLGFFEKEYIPVTELKQGIYVNELGEKAGLLTGDKILKVNGKVPVRFKDLNSMAVIFGAELEVERNGKTETVQVPEDFFSQVKGPFIFPYQHSVIAQVVPDSTNASLAGIKNGDEFKSVNGQSITNFGELQALLQANKGRNIEIEVDREGASQKLSAAVDGNGKLGFYPAFDIKKGKTLQPYSFGELFSYGTKEGWETIYYNAIGFGKILRGKLNPVDNLQSPIGIAKLYGPEWVWSRFWKMTGLISFILAFMNILPIPALDGGHMMFIGFELIKGKPLSDKFLERAQIVGMLILIPLMVFILGKDIWLIIKDYIW